MPHHAQVQSTGSISCLRPCASIAGKAALSVAVLTLYGWLLGMERLKSGVPGLVAMNPATAVAFMLAGVSLIIVSKERISQPRRLVSQLLAGTVVLIGLATLARYAFGLPIWPDRVLFADQLGDNQMAPNTALQFFVLGAALLLMDVGAQRTITPTQGLSVLAATGAFIALVGYAYGAKGLYGVPAYIPMAVNTAAVMAILAIGILCARPGYGFVRALAWPSAGGVILRRLLPTTLLIPVALGWLQLWGQHAREYDAEFGTSLFVGASVVVLMVVTWRTAAALHASDTEREQALALVRQLNADLETRVSERTAELTQTNRQLLEKNRENETFVYSVSHDLRSPLVNLQGFGNELTMVCQQLRSTLAGADVPPAIQRQGLDLVDGDMAEAIRFIQTAVVRLSAIIDALLRLSRAGRVEYDWQAVEVQPMVGRVVQSMAVTISERQATVKVGRLPVVWGDPTAVEQIFANLIGNALNYLDATRPGCIEIDSIPLPTRSADGESFSRAFIVKDNGLGIPEAHQAKVFQAFQRLHPRVAKGEGMGLTLVHRMVERHGGRIWFESAPGVGTTFYLTLPAPQPAVPGPADWTEQPTLVTAGSLSHGD